MVTIAQSQIMFHSTKNKQIVPVIRSPLSLTSLLLSPAADPDLNSEDPLHMQVHKIYVKKIVNINIGYYVKS